MPGRLVSDQAFRVGGRPSVSARPTVRPASPYGPVSRSCPTAVRRWYP